MYAKRLLQWLRALLRPAPLLGVAMIAVLWLGLFYVLSDHHGALADPQRREIFVPVVIFLTLLELIIMATSIRRR